MYKNKCYHERNSWLICGGYIEWCFVCGAFRKMKIVKKGVVTSDGRWAKPSGNKNINPWKKYERT